MKKYIFILILFAACTKTFVKDGHTYKVKERCVKHSTHYVPYNNGGVKVGSLYMQIQCDSSIQDTIKIN